MPTVRIEKLREDLGGRCLENAGEHDLLIYKSRTFYGHNDHWMG